MYIKHKTKYKSVIFNTNYTLNKNIYSFKKSNNVAFKGLVIDINKSTKR